MLFSHQINNLKNMVISMGKGSIEAIYGPIGRNNSLPKTLGTDIKCCFSLKNFDLYDPLA